MLRELGVYLLDPRAALVGHQLIQQVLDLIRNVVGLRCLRLLIRFPGGFQGLSGSGDYRIMDVRPRMSVCLVKLGGGARSQLLLYNASVCLASGHAVVDCRPGPILGRFKKVRTLVQVPALPVICPGSRFKPRMPWQGTILTGFHQLFHFLSMAKVSIKS